MRNEFLVGEMLLAAAARIVKFDAVVIADRGEVIRVEESSRVGEFRTFIAILEATARIADVEVSIELVTWREWCCQLVDGVKIAGAGGYDMECAAELNV